MTLVSLLIGVKISLTLDYQTSPNNLSFMAVMGYYIDQDWKYKEALLDFEPLIGAHTGRLRTGLGRVGYWVVAQQLEPHPIKIFKN